MEFEKCPFIISSNLSLNEKIFNESCVNAGSIILSQKISKWKVRDVLLGVIFLLLTSEKKSKKVVFELEIFFVEKKIIPKCKIDKKVSIFSNTNVFH